MGINGHTILCEDYVSFEIAKLLKEKGFDVPCNCYGAYNGVDLAYRFCLTNKYTNWNKHFDKTIISCPTLQMAMKWLREVHGLFISIGNDDLDYNWQIFDVRNRTKDLDPTCLTDSYAGYGKCEQAVEAAIKYCLENLI